MNCLLPYCRVQSKCFFNGKKLVRGLENDYTINYNTAEIRFTHRVPVTRDSRIQVDYQYSDKKLQ